MNQGWTYRDRIQSRTARQTVLAYYSQRYKHSSPVVWQARIAQQQILLNGQPTHPQAILKNGDQLSYHRPPWEEPTVPLAFSVLYEDAHLWVINKPAGLPVLPGGGFLEHTLLHQLRSQLNIQQSAEGISKTSADTPIPVHRLGRGTSGAILLARTQAARAHLSKQFRDRSQAQDQDLDQCKNRLTKPSHSPQTLTKIYRALIGPTTPNTLSDRFTCTYPIGKLPHNQLGHIYGHCAGHSPTGLHARSECTVLKRTSTSTLLEVSISTGRPHQIRIHLAAAGYPLLGDPLYPVGGRPDPDCTACPGDIGYALHAHQLRFIHPESGHPITIIAPPPENLKTD